MAFGNSWLRLIDGLCHWNHYLRPGQVWRRHIGCLGCLLDPLRRGAPSSSSSPLVGTERGLPSPLIPVTLEGQPKGLSAREFCQRRAAAGVAAVMLRPCRPWWLHLCPRCPSFGRRRRATAALAAVGGAVAAPCWLGHAVSPLLQQRPEWLPLAGPAQRTPGRCHSAASTPWTWAPATPSRQLPWTWIGSAMTLPRPCRRADPVTRSAQWTFARSLSPESSSSAATSRVFSESGRQDSAHGGNSGTAAAVLGCLPRWSPDFSFAVPRVPHYGQLLAGSSVMPYREPMPANPHHAAQCQPSATGHRPSNSTQVEAPGSMTTCDVVLSKLCRPQDQSEPRVQLKD